MDDSEFFKRLFKWIGRGFKKVGRGLKKVGGFLKKNWKKVAIIGLVAATAFFTFGSSLGLTAGWAAKIGGLVSKLGITGKMGNIVAGAIVQAGRGALVGGALGAVTGQGFYKGAGLGALTGAALGGVAGAFQPVLASGASTLSNTASGAATPGVGAGGTIPAGQLAGEVLQTSAPSSLSSSFSAAAPSLSFGGVWDKVIGSGGLGPIIQGIGGGISQGLQSRSGEQRDKEVRESYNIDYGKPQAPMFKRVGEKLMLNHQ